MSRLSSTLLLAIILLSINSFSQEWIPLKSQDPTAPRVKLVSCNEVETVVAFSLEGYSKEMVETQKGTQHTITVPKMASMLEEGAPDLPLFAIPVVIDNLAEMEVIVTDAQYHDFQDIEIAPSKGNLSRTINPDDVPFNYGEVYSKNEFYPTKQALLDQPYILRDLRGQNILVYPFAYNPVKKVLRVYTDLTLTMHKTNEKGKNQKLSQKTATKISPETDAMYKRHFINYKENITKYSFLPDAGEMLVICAPTYLEAMQPFVEWKNISGRPTTLVSLDDIGGDNTDQIKDFILSHYNNPEENLCFVLLVGDYQDLRPKYFNGEYSDIWFGQLEGNDYYPEVFVGRFSVESVSDVENQVNKVIHYERDITTEDSWLSKGIGIGSTEGAGSGHNGGESDYQHIDYIRDTLLHYTYSEVSQHYAGVGAGTNAAMLSQNFNAGAGICNYCNHGTTTSWYVGSFNNSHINALVNDYKWPFIWSTACLNGQFDANCFAEAWMRATNNSTGAPTGAIGGMFSWSSQPWQPPMTGQDEMVDVLCEWRSADHYHHTLGGASLNGNMRILDLHPSDQGFTHNTWILFGDPSLMLRTATPEPMYVICQPEVIFIGQNELHLIVDSDYALATLSVDGNVLCSTPVVNGEATLTFESPTQEGTAQLVVTGYNKVSHVQDIQIIPANGAYLTFDSFSVNNENGQADYGQTCTMDITIKNLGNEVASNVQVSLTSNSSYLEILTGETTIPSIGALEQFTIEERFQIRVADYVNDGTQADLSLICSDGTNTWTSNFRMTLHAPKFILTDFRPETNVGPGQDGILRVSIRNTGSATAHNARIELYSSSTDISLRQTTFHLGNISAGETSSTQVQFSSNQNITTGSSYEMMYIVEAERYMLDGKEFLNIGSIKETFETGNFGPFDWQTLGGASWYIDNSTSNTGTYSVRSGVIGNANLTTLQVIFNVLTDGHISFYKKTCTQADKDKLTFYIDSQTMGVWSGEIDWGQETFNVTAGIHTFKWIYVKDSSGSYGDDACWIDDIQFPASAIIEMQDGPELQVTVNQQNIDLSWESLGAGYEYIIYCDGYPLTSQNETHFSETRPNGTYLYSVVAKLQNTLTAPSFTLVQIGTLDLIEAQNGIMIYPNPTSGIIHVETVHAPFQTTSEYRILNLMGQQILYGKLKETTQIDLTGQAKGVYIMQITNDGQTMTQKIVVQ